MVSCEVCPTRIFLDLSGVYIFVSFRIFVRGVARADSLDFLYIGSLPVFDVGRSRGGDNKNLRDSGEAKIMAGYY